MKRIDAFLRIASGRMSRRQAGAAGAILLALLTGADPTVAHKRTRHTKRECPQSSQTANRGRPCGGIAAIPCPDGFICVDDPHDDCDPAAGGADCPGICVPIGENPCAAIRCRQGTKCCPKCGGICIRDDLRCSNDLCVSQSCNHAVCGPGEFCCNESCSICAPLGGSCTDQFCEPEPRGMCGGIAGIPCPDGFVCVDDPGDDCDPAAGGADCSGICVPIGENPCATILCLEGTICCPQCGGICIPPDVLCSEDLCVSERCNQAVCGPGEYCCNESCSICAPLGGGCTDQVCEPGMCGGIAAIPCPDGFICIDDPRDDCDPAAGGADCPGICVRKVQDPCATIRCRQGTKCCPKCGGICIPNDLRCSNELCVSEPCGPTVCPVGQVCCNESCGICTPPGGVCILIACIA
jgi:hypothetical protein